MRLREFGPTGFEVPVIGQGTWQMEAEDWDECIEALRRGIELGLTHIDTAELYGNGKVEERIVAPAIKGLRKKVFLVSKVHPLNAGYEETIEACERSLRRLGTTWLDCYLLHWRSPVPLEETFRAFERLRKDGKIRSYGVSNFDERDLKEAYSIVGEGKLACNQVLYHLKERSIEELVLPWCRREAVAVVGYSPFGSGDFPSARSHEGHVLFEIAQSYGVDPHAVALAFLTRADPLFTIPKASSVEHVELNAQAADLTLTASEIEELDRAFQGETAEELPMM